MKLIIKIITVFLVIILLIASVFIVFSLYTEDDEKKKDTIPPTIDEITRDTTGTTGKITTITISFSDNVNVTKATIFYKSANAEDWDSASIINGKYDIKIQEDSVEDWFYYVTIDDAAGNGPIGSPSVDGSSYFTIDVRPNIESLVHNVLIEEGTANWCPNCPVIGEYLNDIYKSGDYNFYYISMVEDQNNKAKKHLEEDYNIYGYPTVYIDGGFDVLVGGNIPKSTIVEQIKRAEERESSKININVSSEYDENKNEINTKITLTNYENNKYSGSLKVYLTEIVSRWLDYDGKSYHYGFLDYIKNEELEIEAEEEITIIKSYDITEISKSYDSKGECAENLMIIASVFNSEPFEKFSNSDEKENKFDAYFADATDGTRVIKGGNLPPEIIGINIEKGKLHIFGKPLIKTLLKNTIFIGKTTITVEAEDDGEIKWVEFYINNELVANITDTPYEWIFDETKNFKIKHTIKIIAYDDQGKSSSPFTLEVIPIFFT